MLTLIGSLTSPYVRKVRVALSEKKVEYVFKLEDTWANDSDLAKINPLLKVPCLIFEDGFVVVDSRVIVEHIDIISPVAKLIPQTGRQRIEIKTIEALADGILDACVNVRLEQTDMIRTDGERCQAWVDRNLRRVHGTLDHLENKMSDKTPYFIGSTISLGDIAVSVALGYLDFRFPHIDWRSGHPKLTQLYKKMSERSSFIETCPPQS
jgi:glutathione S-transferase